MLLVVVFAIKETTLELFGVNFSARPISWFHCTVKLPMHSSVDVGGFSIYLQKRAISQLIGIGIY